MFDFSEKIVVVCGASGLIGKEISSCLLAQNATVVSLDLFLEEDSDSKNPSFACDINSSDQVQQTLQKIIEKYGRIDSWINCAYPRTKDWGKSLEDSDKAWFDANITLHLGGYFNVSKYVLEILKKQNFGSMTNFSSIYGVVGPNFSVYEGLSMVNPVAYSAIKAGIINMGRYFATAYGPYGVRVNTISPGGVLDNQNETFIARYSALTPLGRMAAKEEIAGAAIFLSSEAASYITGHNLIVDGGWTAH